MLDLIIRNGRVIDGSGSPSYFADIGIQGERIVTIGKLNQADAANVIDARHHVVCPGFIDMHLHSDMMLIAAPRNILDLSSTLRTELVSPC